MTIKLFAGSDFYPSGGYEDFQGRFYTIEEAKTFFHEMKERNYWQWAQLVCVDTIIETGHQESPLYDNLIEWKKNDPSNS